MTASAEREETTPDRNPAEAMPYPDSAAFLRDELWRTWLCVAYHIHSRWESGVLPRTLSEGAGMGATAIASLLRNAAEPYDGVPLVEAGAPALLEAFRAHSVQIELRLRATEAAGVVLPFIDLVRCFQLTPRQRATLTLALMPELDPDLLLAYRYLSQDSLCRGLDPRLLALLVYDTPESRPQLSLDLSPASPLLRYRLLEIEETAGFDLALYRRLQPVPRLMQLASEGARDLDPQLAEVATLAPASPPGLFAPDLLERVTGALGTPGVLLVLQGPRGVGKRLLLANAAAERGGRVLHLQAAALASLPREQLRSVLRGLVRELRLLDAVPVVPDLDDLLLHKERGEELPEFLGLLANLHPGAIALTFTRPHLPRIDLRAVVQIALVMPTFTERLALWQRAVPALGEGDAEMLAERFAIPGGVIEQATRAAASVPEGTTFAGLDRAVGAQIHDRLSRLGRRLETHYTFDDLIVEPDILEALLEIGSAISHRRRVHELWGLRGAAGLSILFSGSPGVGKTMGATVLARELGLGIYEIDLPSVVSKWIGETEKNLEEILSAAEPGHAILLFNEADALFGRRTVDVRTATDRYANLETNYLLQRLEKFSGVAILTTNLTSGIDAAFRRRFNYDVQFSFPSPEMREQLWRRAVPLKAHTGDIDFQTLAEKFELSGGFIKLAVERSALVAAAAGEPLTTRLIVPLVQRMYLERGKLAPIGRLE